MECTAATRRASPTGNPRLEYAALDDAASFLRAGIFVNDGKRRVSAKANQEGVHAGLLDVGLMASAVAHRLLDRGIAVIAGRCGPRCGSTAARGFAGGHRLAADEQRGGRRGEPGDTGRRGTDAVLERFMTAGEDLADQDLAASYELGSLR